MTTELSIEKQIILYECLKETARFVNLETIEKAFYCGRRVKWGLPNTLLVVVPEDKDSRYFSEMSNEGGCTGSAYLDYCTKTGTSPWSQENREYTFHYKIITNIVFNSIFPDWARLRDGTWLHNVYPIELDLDKLQRYYEARAFL